MTTPLPLSTKERSSLFKQTAATPRLLEKFVGNMSARQFCERPRQGFSVHEHIWHLTDLEIEATKPRIHSLLSIDNPDLENFDGDTVAVERDYHGLSLQDGIKQFQEARLHNLWILSGISHADWMRRGNLEYLGVVTVADLFRNMARHDCDHLNAIQALLNNSNLPSPVTVAA